MYLVLSAYLSLQGTLRDLLLACLQRAQRTFAAVYSQGRKDSCCYHDAVFCRIYSIVHALPDLLEVLVVGGGDSLYRARTYLDYEHNNCLQAFHLLAGL